MKRNHKSMAGAALTAGLTALALAGCTVGPVTLPDINIDLGFLKGIGIVTTSVADAEAAIRDVRECGVDPSELVEQGTLTVGLLPSNSAPLNATKQDGSRAGIDVEVAYAMADHVGLPVKFVTVSSAATSLDVDCDVVMGVPTSDAASSTDAVVLGDYAESAIAVFGRGKQGEFSASDLAGKTSLSKSDILSYPLVVSGGDIQRVCEKVFGKASIYMVTADSLFRYQVVQKGQAITVVPAFHHIVDSGAQGTVIVPMKEPYYLEVGFVAKRDVMESPVVKRLFAQLNAYYSKFASSPYISLVPSEITSVSAEEARSASTMDSLCKRFCGKYKLSQREGEILVPLLAGKTARPIAEELSVGTATVKSHIYSIYKKAGVHSQKDLMSLFREMEA